MNKKQTIELLKTRTMMFAHEYLTFVGNKGGQSKKERLNAEISDLKSILESLRIY